MNQIGLNAIYFQMFKIFLTLFFQNEEDMSGLEMFNYLYYIN